MNVELSPPSSIKSTIRFTEHQNRNPALLKGLLCCAESLSRVQLCNSMDCSPPGCSVHGDSPGKNTGVGCHALLQETFPIQGSNPGLPHGRRILYGLSHQGSPTEGDTRNKWSSPKKSKFQLKWQVCHNHKQCKIKCTLAYISIQLLRAKILSGKEEIRKV